MNGYTECPNCVMDRLIVPLKSRGHFSVCPVCEKTFEKFISEN